MGGIFGDNAFDPGKLSDLYVGEVNGISNMFNPGGSKVNTNYVRPEQVAQAYQNTQTGLSQQQDFLKAIQAQNGMANQSSVFSQQQVLANNLAQQAQGAGPNPAQAMLANQTGTNVANQAALMSGQRGAGQNVGMMARQAAMQGANTQQQAIGQAASLQAQQQLEAQKQLQVQQAQMGTLAGQQVNTEQNAVNQYQQGALGQQSNLLGGQAAANKAASDQQANNNQMMGSLMGAVGSVAAFLNEGGEVPNYDQGGKVGVEDQIRAFGDRLKNAWGVQGSAPQAGPSNPDLSKTGEQIIHDTQATYGPKSYVGKHVNGMHSGGSVVPGKAVAKGDSIKNDKVKAMLSPGEIVIPRSIAQHPNAPDKAREFVAAIMAKKGMAK